MLGIFKSASFTDALLGELRRKRGAWRGAIDVGGVSAPLTLAGSRAAPDPHALEIARAIPSAYADWGAGIATAMFEHYTPYAEAVAAGEIEAPAEGLPRIVQPDDVWRHISVEFVAVTPLDRVLTVEIGYRVVWDDEHTLGARLQNGKLIELNGSVLPP